MALQSYEIALIILLILVVFGPFAIPKLMRSLGRAKGEFLAARSEFDQVASKTEAEARARSAAVRAREATQPDAPTASAAPATAGSTTASGAGSATVGASAPVVRTPPSEEDVRKAARDVGIQEDGMTIDEVKRALNELLE